MFILIVKFHSGLADTEVRRNMEDRLSMFRAVPGLLQKYYAQETSTGDYCGIYLFDSEESLRDYRNSELARSIPPTYQLDGPARVEMMELLYPLRPENIPEVSAD
jgi:hypothetical protein